MSDGATPAVEGLFREGEDGARLCGSRCAHCGTPAFPKSALGHSADCDDSQMQDAEFGPNGTVWSYSVQHYPPPPPAMQPGAMHDKFKLLRRSLPTALSPAASKLSQAAAPAPPAAAVGLVRRQDR